MLNEKEWIYEPIVGRTPDPLNIHAMLEWKSCECKEFFLFTHRERNFFSINIFSRASKWWKKILPLLSKGSGSRFKAADNFCLDRLLIEWKQII